MALEKIDTIDLPENLTGKIKMKALARFKGKWGNDIEAHRTDLMGDNQVAILDHSAQIERVYTVGRIQDLGGDKPSKIKSVEQVINAWKNGDVWF